MSSTPLCVGGVYRKKGDKDRHGVMLSAKGNVGIIFTMLGGNEQVQLNRSLDNWELIRAAESTEAMAALITRVSDLASRVDEVAARQEALMDAREIAIAARNAARSATAEDDLLERLTALEALVLTVETTLDEHLASQAKPAPKGRASK